MFTTPNNDVQYLLRFDVHSPEFQALKRYYAIAKHNYLRILPKMDVEDIMALPREFVLNKCSGEISYIWDKLPASWKEDPAFKQYEPCVKHEDTRRIRADHINDCLLLRNCPQCFKEFIYSVNMEMMQGSDEDICGREVQSD